MRSLLMLLTLYQLGLRSGSTIGVCASAIQWRNGRDIKNTLVERQDGSSSNTTFAAPIVAEPSQHWEGVDGTWSTFTIRIGTPSSTYRVLPATSWQETWVVYGSAAGVCNTTIGVAKECQEARGGAIDITKSETWKDEGQHTLGLNEDLGMDGVGQYGFDTLGLGYTNTSSLPTLPNQIISAIVSDDYWFGLFGLGFQPTNFSGYDNPQPSFSESLFTDGKISSRSWSYTAGAYYRLKSVFGSLVFGGYDESRFVENDVVFTMTGDNLKDIVVTIRSISSTMNGKNETLMNTPEFAFIDSTVPELWLPRTVCDAFEKRFGLQYDSASDLYLLNTSAHNALTESDPSITLTLANQKEGGETTDITFPYAAFDLSAYTPKLPNVTEAEKKSYFPIRRGEEGSYVLGRTFLQEAYVTVHYGSRTFNVSQCVFEDGARSRIIALPETLPSSATESTPGNTSDPSSGGSKKLGAGAIAGIVIGVLALFLLLGLIFFCLRKRKSKRQTQAVIKEERGPSLPIDAVEIDAGTRLEKPGRWQTAHTGEQASSFTNEVAGNDAKVEIEGNPIMVPQELEAEVPHRYGEVPAVPGTLPGGGRTPMAEMGRGERGLGEREEDLVSPNTDTNRNSIDGGHWRDREAGEVEGRPSIMVSSPSGSENTWSPSSPVRRTGTNGSRFHERLS